MFHNWDHIYLMIIRIFFQVLQIKKGHCYINMDGENAFEYLRFYDFEDRIESLARKTLVY